MDDDDSFQAFTEGTQLVLPGRLLDRYWKRLAEGTSSERLAEYRNELESSGYRRLYEQMFAEEMLYVSSLHPRTLKEVTAFQRGAGDLAVAQRKDIHLHERMKTMIAMTDELLAWLLKDEYFNAPPQRICEIGGAWGATIAHLTNRFSPVEYQNYEIDPVYAEFAQDELGARAMPCDGESLSGTATDSIDLVVANNVLFFVPPIKTYRYMKEMARVTAPGGVVLFNVVVADTLSEDKLVEFLDDWFPRRAFSLVPQRFLDLAFPPDDFSLLATDETHPGKAGWTYHIYRRNPGG